MAAVTRRQYKGAAASTTTTNALTSGDTSVTLAATTGWPSTAAVPFYVVIDPGTSSEEKCSVTISGSTLTLTRAQDDTTAVAHSSGATIYPVFSADEADEANSMASTMTTKGDLLVTTGSAFNRLAVGTNGFGLIADSGSANGVKWGTPYNTTVSSKTASYTLVAADVGTRIVMNAGATNTTITVNTSLFAAGDTLSIHNVGTGNCTVTAGTCTVAFSSSLVVPPSGGGTLFFTSTSASIFFATGNIDPTIATSNRNVFINGGFDVWQRGTTSATTGQTYLADRWARSVPTGGTQSQDTDVPSVQYRYSWKHIASATNSFMQSGQQIEFQNCKQFQNQATTISFWAKAINSNAGSTALVVRTRTIVGVDGSCVFVGTNVDTSVTLTTSWVRYTVARTMPATFGSASLELVLGSHLSGDGFFVTGIQWELGSVATPFEFENIGTTLAKCQRYFEKSYNVDVAPATATNAGMSFVYASASGSSNVGKSVNFKVYKRTTPTMVGYSATGVAGQFSNAFAPPSGSVITTNFTAIGESAFIFYNSNTATEIMATHWTATAEL